jgi:hypothetical protein
MKEIIEFTLRNSAFIFLGAMCGSLWWRMRMMEYVLKNILKEVYEKKEKDEDN